MTSLVSGILGALGLANLPTPDSLQAMATCQAISAFARVQTMSWPLETMASDYAASANHYWSSANAKRDPACVILPTNAEEVSRAVETLLQHPNVPFAVKSGGHNPNVGFASTDGVLISLKHMNSTTLSSDKAIAYLSPGATWGKAVGDLEPYNVTVVGGRIGDVGVGGLLVGCGLSFLSSQYGLPCDYVTNYEVVLANGTIVNANAQSNPDLFWALKGGGNQFGIVTKFTIKTIPLGLIWGGYRLYTTNPEISSAILNATQDFTENQTDPRAAIIVTVEILLDSLSQFWAIFFFYNGPILPTGVFDKFPTTHYLDTTKPQTYSSLLNSNAELASIYGFRYLLRGQTIPNLPGRIGTDLLNANYQNFKDYAIKSKLDLDNLANLDLGAVVDVSSIFNLIFQPMPFGIPAMSARANPAGNLLNLSPDNGDHLWMACTVSWSSPARDAWAYNKTTEIMDNIVKYAQATQARYPGIRASNFKAGAANDDYTPPIFMNDAMADQQVLQGYGSATYSRLKTIQRTYDPSGFFPSRTGGFKLI